MIKEELDNKLHRILNGKHTSEEKKSIEAIQKIDVVKNWERFQNLISSKTPVRFSFIQRNRIYFTRIAAAILLLILTAICIYTIKLKTNYKIQQISSIQENTEVILADGSMILMNKGSVISFPENLNHKRREVKLSGEAWFKITRAKASPFYIHLKNSTVEVLSTSFNIKEEENGKVIVSVVSGRVLFYENNNNDNAVILEVGQQGVFDGNTKKIEQSTYNSENFLFWKTGRLSFRNVLLDNVFKELEKSYNTSIVVMDKNILQNRLTTYCEGQSLDEILIELTKLFDLQYYLRRDTIYVEKMPI